MSLFCVYMKPRDPGKGGVKILIHGSDKPGEPGKPGDMINILKSQGEPGKVREKISKILQVMEESGRFF